MAYLIGVDLGTSSLKTVLIDEDGNQLAISSKKYSISSPKQGYAEQDPAVWWGGCASCINACIESSSACAADIKGVSFSGQMHGLVALDSEYNVIRPAILHCDTRSTEQVEKIKSAIASPPLQTDFNPVYTGFLLSSLLWMKDKEPLLYEKIRYVMLPKDYLRFMLTGVIATDYSDASGTLAFDVKNLCWSKELLERLCISLELFPAVYQTYDLCGKVTAAAALLTGLREGTPVAAGGGDQVMQALGNGVTGPSLGTVNIGTSGQVSYISDSPVFNQDCGTNTFCSYEKGKWFTMGAIMSAGHSLQWFTDLFKDLDYQSLDRDINTQSGGVSGILFLPYLSGERTPHMNPNLRGVMAGLSHDTNREEMALSIMEGVAFALYQCMQVCDKTGLTARKMVVSGGGAQSRIWCRILANVFNTALYRTVGSEQAAIGAAIVAGIGIGIYKNVEEGCRRVVKYESEVIIADIEMHKKYMDYYALYLETSDANRLLLEKLTALNKKND